MSSIFLVFHFSAIVEFSSNLGLLFYSDPGSGALLWQLIAAFFVGGMFYASFAFRKIKMFVGKTFGLTSGKNKITKNNSYATGKVPEN